jgi:hypothetical protein
MIQSGRASMRFPVGSSVWGVDFDAASCRFRPVRLGVVLRSQPGAIEVSRGAGKPEWIGENTFPLFGSEGDAASWCDCHLPFVPALPRAEVRA